MFPLYDENPTVRAPVVTYALIAVTALAWVFVQGAGGEAALIESVCELGMIPGELTGRAAGEGVRVAPGAICLVGDEPRWWTLLTSMFLHGSWFHIIANVWFLWVFGNNIEDSMGRGRFVVFYLLCGVVAALAQLAADPGAPVPMVGASGAVSGVMGAYILLFPRVRVHVLVFLGFLVTTVRLPAYGLLGYWFVLQLLGGLVPQLEDVGGVAFWAHVGGFVAGLALITLFRDRELVERHRASHLV